MTDADIAIELAKFANQLETLKVMSVLIFVLGAALVISMIAMIRNNRRDDDRLTNVLESNRKLEMALIRTVVSFVNDISHQMTDIRVNQATIIEHLFHTRIKDETHGKQESENPDSRTNSDSAEI